MPLTVHSLSPAIGAEIRGVDISQPLEPAILAEIRAAWLDHCILLFRDQELDSAAQRRFVGSFGPVGGRAPRRTDRRKVEGPDYQNPEMLVTNIRENGKQLGVLPDGEMWFHHDMCYAEAPNRASFLYAIEVPSTGGNTKFANMYRAWENLPERLKDRLRGRTVLQVYDDMQVGRQYEAGPLDSFMHWFQPAVVRHPETGRPALYINRLMTHRIEGLPPAESETLIEDVLRYTEDPSIVYEHVWRPGDLIMWDNLCSTHARTDFPANERRLMRRFTIGGEPVQPAFAAVTAG